MKNKNPKQDANDYYKKFGKEKKRALSSGIVIVDDEESDIDELRETLVGIVSRRMIVDYVSSSQEILVDMKEKAKCKPYSALITDFNMDGITGKQLIQIVTGRLNGIDNFVVPNITSFNQVEDAVLKECLCGAFTSVADYARFRLKYENIVMILHSSSNYGDGNNDLPDNVDFVHKRSSNPCEQIVDILRDKNVLTARELKIYKGEIQPKYFDCDDNFVFS